MRAYTYLRYLHLKIAGYKSNVPSSPELDTSFDLSLKRFTIYKSQLLLKPYHSHNAKVDQPQRGHNTHL